MNGTITWANGSTMEEVSFSTPDGSDVPISVDENGTFETYVESGDYIVVVAPMLNGDGVTESLRMPITIDSDSSVRTGLLALVEAVEVSLTLKEAGTESELVGKNVVLVSHDGFGNIAMNPSDADGNATQLLMQERGVCTRMNQHLNVIGNRYIKCSSSHRCEYIVGRYLRCIGSRNRW